MSSRAWGDMIAGDRMAVDQEFDSEVEASRFNRQQWGLVMTAVEFEIHDPADDDRARLVANTEKLPHVMGELDNVGSMNPMGGGESSDGGLVDSLKSSLGIGGSDDTERREAAERLTARYAERLQSHLENHGKWGDVRAAAQR